MRQHVYERLILDWSPVLTAVDPAPGELASINHETMAASIFSWGQNSAVASTPTLKKNSHYGSQLPQAPSASIRPILRLAVNRTLAQYPTSLRRTLIYDNRTDNIDIRKSMRVFGTRPFICTLPLLGQTAPSKTVSTSLDATFPKRPTLPRHQKVA